MAAAGSSISDTVDRYDRHVVLCWKGRESWPPSFELPEADVLPRKLFKAFNDRKHEMERKTILTVCEGGKDDVYFADGDIFIFPDMIRYTAVKETDNLDEFVEDVLVKDIRWRNDIEEMMIDAIEATYVFVCAHKSNDEASGVKGEAVLQHMKNLVMWNGMRDNMFVRACSSIQGHQDYAASLIIYSMNSCSKVDGHWYGLVTPSTVSEVLESHIGRGFMYEQLWRGNMGPKWEPKQGRQRFERGELYIDILKQQGYPSPWSVWQTSEKPKRSEHDMVNWLMFFRGAALGATIAHLVGFPKIRKI